MGAVRVVAVEESVPVAVEGLSQVQSSVELGAWIEGVMQESLKEVERYRSGETRLLGYFIGKVMQKSEGRADPKALSTLIRDRLGS